MSHKEKIAISYIFICILLTIALPYLLTHYTSRFGLTSSPGEIGDTIGGITSPLIGLLSAILIYITLNEQIKANELLNNQINHDNRIKQISELLKTANEIVSSMRYHDNIADKRYYGEEALRVCLERICRSHENIDAIRGAYNYEKVKNVLHFFQRTANLTMNITKFEEKETYSILFQELYYSKYKNELTLFSVPCQECGGKTHEYDPELISIIQYLTSLNFKNG